MTDPKRILVILAGFAVLAMGVWAIKGHLDSNGYKNQVNYTTAVQATDQDSFNYIVDSQQGRVLARGEFKAEGELSKFDEMTEGFTYVNRVKEQYTMHTRTVCTSDGDGGQSCHTEVYYTWDEVDNDTVLVNSVSFMGRSYPSGLFNFEQYKAKTDCEAFASRGTGTGLFQKKQGCIDGKFYLDNDTRYVYSTVPVSFSAAFLATTYDGLNAFNEKSITLQNKSIDQILKDVGKYKLISFWVAIVLFVFLTVGAIVAAYLWVMQDGEWSLDD